MKTTKILFDDGTSINIEGRWKAQIGDIYYPDEMPKWYDEEQQKEYYEKHPEVNEFWIDFFLFDERCYVPMISFYGLVRPPCHIGTLHFVFQEEQ